MVFRLTFNVFYLHSAGEYSAGNGDAGVKIVSPLAVAVALVSDAQAQSTAPLVPDAIADCKGKIPLSDLSEGVNVI